MKFEIDDDGEPILVQSNQDVVDLSDWLGYTILAWIASDCDSDEETALQKVAIKGLKALRDEGEYDEKVIDRVIAWVAATN